MLSLVHKHKGVGPIVLFRRTRAGRRQCTGGALSAAKASSARPQRPRGRTPRRSPEPQTGDETGVGSRRGGTQGRLGRNAIGTVVRGSAGEDTSNADPDLPSFHPRSDSRLGLMFGLRSTESTVGSTPANGIGVGSRETGT